MKYADLHVHTNFSDGTFSPEEVVRYAKEKGLSAIAICDHDSVDAIDPSRKHAEHLSIEIIPGIELTVIEKHKEVHLLGYFISWKSEWLQKILKKVQEDRIVRLNKMIEKLKGLNVKVDSSDVMAIDNRKGSVGRLHLARTLAKTGVVSSVRAAFEKYIGESGPCYVEDIGFGAKEAIDIILKANGVPVIAHPGVIGDDSMVEEFIKYGIRGIEAFHGDHTPGERRRYEQMAKANGLLALGGSDCHGRAKNRVLMGSVKVPYAVVENLKKEAEEIKSHGGCT